MLDIEGEWREGMRMAARFRDKEVLEGGSGARKVEKKRRGHF